MTVNVRYLGWAGLEIEADGETVIVDAMGEAIFENPLMGEPQGDPVLSPDTQAAQAALVTHLHLDHADPGVISGALAPDGVILRPSPATGEMLETIALDPAEKGLAPLPQRKLVTEPWESHEIGPFKCTAVPAVDGFGDPQVSWVIEAEGKRILHAGDTVFHGSWWLIKMRLGPIDAAFLPVNGPIVDLPHRQPPSPLPAVMGPEQAATAAMILEAGVAVPIHFREIDNPPVYTPGPDPGGAFSAAAARLNAPVGLLETGEVLSLT